MRIFMTGGNGFIGSVVARRLVERGASVVLLLRETSQVDRIADLPFERVPGDVRDGESLRRGMRGCDATIHLAAPGGWEADDPTLMTHVLEDGTRNVLDAAAGLRSHRVVFVSSTAAVSAASEPIVFDERSPFSVPDSSLHYAFAKHRAEAVAQEAHANGVDVVTVNPAEVYGPGDTALATAGNLLDFAKSKPVFVCRGGTSIVHVDDVASGMLAALDRGRSGERYILGGENLTIRELARLTLELVDRRSPIITVPNRVVRALARGAIRLRIPVWFNPHVVPYATWYWFVDNAKARRDLGVSFRSARETIGSTIQWLRGGVEGRSLLPPV